MLPHCHPEPQTERTAIAPINGDPVLQALDGVGLRALGRAPEHPISKWHGAIVLRRRARVNDMDEPWLSVVR